MKTAEEVLDKILNPLSSRISDIKAIKAYARIQIEKDRERLKVNIGLTVCIDEVPIILD